MPAPTVALVPYVTNTEFLIFFDNRWVGQNLLDAGVPATLANMQDPTTTAGGVLYRLLAQASELVMGAAAVGARYTDGDIRPRLTDNPPYAGGGSLLIRIVCDLTMGLILKRRARAVTDEQALSGPYTEALLYLEQLRRGERIFFNVPNVPEAGLPAVQSLLPLPGIDPPTIVQQSQRYFGYPAGSGYWTGQVQGEP